MSERRGPMEINVDGESHAVAFSTNGAYVLSGGRDWVHVWRVEDGKKVARMRVKTPWCLAVSKDGRWIAAGTVVGLVVVWDANTYEQVFTLQHHRDVHAVDFSPDSTRLVSASKNCTAIVWDIARRRQVQTLSHKDSVFAAKYSPQGDRIATATSDSVRVYDSDGRLLVDIKVSVTLWFNTGLLWSNDCLLVISNGKIKQLEASTGSVVSEWPVPDNRTGSPRIAIPKHGKFIAYSAERTLTFWDTSTHTQLGRIQHPQAIRSIAVSPDNRFIAIGGDSGTITIESLSPITDSIPLSRQHPTFQEPDLQINDAALDLWKQDQLTDAQALLTTAITASDTNHHVLACRALVWARLQEWDTAIADAEMAINLQPSVVGYIAKSIALVGKGERHKAYRACDIAFEHFHSSHVTFLLLIKAIIVFMAGEHLDAISRVDDIIATVEFNSICYVVQAYMYLLVGNLRMECRDYDGATQSFERAQAKMRHHTSQPLSMISLMSGWKFDNLGTAVQRGLCEALYEAGRTKDAVKCFHQMNSEFGGETNPHSEHSEWALNFRQRSFKKLEHLGDTAVDSQQYDVAVSHYTTALSLDLPSPQDILIKRGKAFVATGSWKRAIDDANQVTMLDPSSPWGYKIKHAALHKAGHYDDAVDAFEAMLSKIAQSPDPDVQRHGDQYISPSSTRARILRIVQRTIRHSPCVLINTSTGRLYNKSEQASAFESLPIFNELVSSTTTRTDYVRIKQEVRRYFRYVTLSHKWEENEPLFHQVIHIAVYDLEMSPTHDKLQTFCKIVRDAGFDWAWSDTCCIDRSNHFVLQEALVAMFKWYQGSAMMIVFLRGVRPSERGALVRSIWNTRAWTLQEYVAAQVIHFYTEDWTLYLDLELPNHKESPEVISEMEQATGVSAQQLMSLRPGLTSIREKLRLASTRHTTLVEDAAYSLLGIFSVTGIHAIYGEGEDALGRLLAHVLAGSGDVSVLAWTGESGRFNSCLPAHITVFSDPATSHLPSPIQDADVERITTTSHTSSFDLDEALRLYDRLNELPSPWFAAIRMKLPCIAFELPSLSPFRTRSGRVYRADTLPFGMVEIRTRHDLSRMQSLYLVYPWLDSLLEREDLHSSASVENEVTPPPSLNTGEEEFDDDDSPSLPMPDLPPLPAPVCTVPMDRETRAQRLVARLRQPFGALLVTLAETNRRAMDYRRVAADSLITVQFQEHVLLADILDNVRTLDIL